jgi:ankyrin repeat protein
VAGNERLIEILLDKGIDVNISDSTGTTPLHALCRATRTLTKKFLLLLTTSSNTNTIALSFDRLLEVLRNAGADFNRADLLQGDTALHLLAEISPTHTKSSQMAKRIADFVSELRKTQMIELNKK